MGFTVRSFSFFILHLKEGFKVKVSDSLISLVSGELLSRILSLQLLEYLAQVREYSAAFRWRSVILVTDLMSLKDKESEVLNSINIGDVSIYSLS
jgi:hypothetical protein